MNPLFLEMINIGPFVERTRMDLSRIEEDGLFLVSGPTGSGKSFIFDTICYSLYGKTPSGREGNMASDHSGIGDKPVIRFGFRLGENEYLTERTLEYTDHAKRGGGTTIRSEKAALFRIKHDETGKKEKQPLVTGKTDVHASIVDILGLEMEQFSRVMMIPQGEFRELLKAETKDRETLLRKLFDSSFFWDVSNELSRRYGDLSDELKDSRSRNDTRIETIVNKLELDSGPGEGLIFDEWSGRITDEKRENVSILEQEEKAAEAKWKDSQKKLELSRDAFETDKKLMNTTVKIEEMERIEKEEMEPVESRLALSGRAGHLREELGRLDELNTNLDQLKRELKKKQDELKRRRSRFDSVTKDLDDNRPDFEKRLDSVKEDILTLKRARPGVEEIQDLSSKMGSLGDEVSRLREMLEDIIGKLNDIEEERKGIEDEMESNPIRGELVKKTAIVRKNGEDLLSILHRSKKIEIELEQLSISKNEKKDLVNEQEARLKKIRMRREDTIAGELAYSLKSGVECPVCGSLEHPSPRHPTDKDVSRDMVKEAEKILDELREKFSRIERKTTVCRTELEGLRKRSEEIRSENSELDLPLDDLSIKVKELKHLEREMEVSARRREHLDRKKELIQKREKELRRTEAEKRDIYTRKMSDLRILENEFAKRSKEIEDLSLDADDPLVSLERRLREMEGIREEISGWLQKMTKEMEEAGQSLARSEQDLSACSARLEELGNKEKVTKDRLNRKISSIEGIVTLDDLKEAILDEDEERRLREILDKFRKELSGLKGSRDEFLRKLDSLGIDVPDSETLESLQKQESLLAAEWKEIHGKLVKAKEDLDWAVGVLDNIRKSRKDMAAKEEEISIVGRLARQVKGNDDPRISLERFFLAQRFEEVLIASNQRLKVLSDGRFLVKRAEVKGRKSKGGLDLNVYDNYTGRERPANTLSGGQMFLSSLALALGLADVVQSRSGGIRMDALFIDEGFGSLDEETLQTALKVLSELRKGRMVGVISHVGELKRQIRTGFEVIPSPEGSALRAIG